MADSFLTLGGIAFIASELTQPILVRPGPVEPERADATGVASATNASPSLTLEWLGTLHGATAMERAASLSGFAQSRAEVCLSCRHRAICIRVTKFEFDATRSREISCLLQCDLHMGHADLGIIIATIEDLITAFRAQKALEDLVRSLARQASPEFSTKSITHPKEEDTQ